jgi:hypothetical protein
MCKVTTTTFVHIIAGWLYIYLQVDFMPSDKKQVNAIGSLPDFLNCPGSDKKVKPSNPEIVSKGKEIQYTAPIQSQVPKSEYIVNICKVTSIFFVQNL